MRPRALMTPRNLEDHRLQGNTPPLNFARNSLTTLSNFESTSLEFCGFLTIAHLSDHRITCEIDDKLRKPTAARRHPRRRSRSPRSHPHLNRCYRATCRPGSHTQAFHEPTQTDIKISEILRSVDEGSRRNRRIVTACACLCRWCARSHFALQLLGF